MVTVDFKRINLPETPRILDIGCGSGRHTSAAYRIKHARVVGADLCYDDLCKARERLEYHDCLGEHGGGAWGLSAANIKRLPFKDDFFDLVICSEVLEHIPDDRTAMEEIVRVLKPGRNLVVSVPRFGPEAVCWALSDEYFNANQGHVRIYKKNDLVKKLKDKGLRPDGSHFAHSIHSPYWWLKCLVGPTKDDSVPVKLYNRFLTWDIMKKPLLTRFLDRLFNPLIGKSLVLYFTKM